MVPAFSEALAGLIQTKGNIAIVELEGFLKETDFGAERLGEAITALGMLDHVPSARHRLHFVAKYLESEDVRIRDAASLGLAYLDDPSALPLVQTAFNKESSQLLKRNLKLVIDQLEQTQHDSTSASDKP